MANSSPVEQFLIALAEQAAGRILDAGVDAGDVCGWVATTKLADWMMALSIHLIVVNQHAARGLHMGHRRVG